MYCYINIYVCLVGVFEETISEFHHAHVPLRLGLASAISKLIYLVLLLKC